MKKTNPISHSLRTAAIIIIAVIVYAYGFQVTKVGFEEISLPRRQESLVRVIRALFHPDILKYEQVETQVSVPFYAPCPSGGFNAPAPDESGSYLIVTPSCAAPRAEITVNGYNFQSNIRSQLYFIPSSEVNLNLGTFETDDSGHFELKTKVPPRPDDQVQHIRTLSYKNVGKPRLSQAAIDTWQKIVETVFLALLATTFGIIFAVPVSFFAARNLMREITWPMSVLSLSLIGWPLGIGLGATVASWLGQQSEILTGNLLWTIVGLIVSLGLIYLIARWSLPQEEEKKPSVWLRLGRSLGLLVSGLLGIFVLYLFASLAIDAGASLAKSLGFGRMMGSFVENLGVILKLIIAIVAGVAGGGIVGDLFARMGRTYIKPLQRGPRLAVNLFLGALAGAIVCLLIGAGLDWIYLIHNPVVTIYVPALLGALLGLLIVFLNREKDSLAIGMAIYYITRTILNGLRAIEALIWVIIFVVWVGIGPFAGVLALALHTIAALAKLYSEQVESIMPGPLEAVRATGATRLQVIVYSVVPQIIPLYISFTMYRWDINVRMSTIIGFAGGGGIGFLLLQNINLLNYRAASTQMLAIAIVVAAMDYLSSYMRERIV
jgi:phosphonate ABC transporter permease subunit PhnE